MGFYTNHTNHNQNRKAHRNGIKKVKKHRYRSLLGVSTDIRRNQKYCRRGIARKMLEAKKNEKNKMEE